MKKLFIIFLIIFSTKSLYAQKASLGLQYTFPSYGISGKYHVNDHNCVQAVFGAFGVLSNYTGRYNYLFEERGQRNVKPFLYAQAGIWKYQFLTIDESTMGFGFGAGLEFDWFYFISENLSTTIEIGYGNVDLVYYELGFTSFGFGLHYNFGY